MKNICKYKILKNAGLVIQFHKNNLTYEDAKKFKLAIPLLMYIQLIIILLKPITKKIV